MNTSNWTIANRRWAIAHELGHGVGLDHNTSTASIMCATKITFWAPSNCEVGPVSPCNDGDFFDTWGVRCVYHYTGNNAGGDTP